MAAVTVTSFLTTAILLLCASAFLRLLYILPSIHPTRPLPRRRHDPTRLLIVLGSGGHTAEMLAILRNLDTSSYTHRTYVVSQGDDFSSRKATDFETSLAKSKRADDNNNLPCDTKRRDENTAYDIYVVPRARKIHQSILTTPVSAVHCLMSCIHILHSPSPSTRTSGPRQYPDLVMTNGPGTAVCVVLACLLLRFFNVRGTKGKMRTIYVESWARVKGLSLSGKILIRCVDRFLVQWDGLRGAGGRAEYLGVLV